MTIILRHFLRQILLYPILAFPLGVPFVYNGPYSTFIRGFWCFTWFLHRSPSLLSYDKKTASLYIVTKDPRVIEKLTDKPLVMDFRSDYSELSTYPKEVHVLSILHLSMIFLLPTLVCKVMIVLVSGLYSFFISFVPPSKILLSPLISRFWVGPKDPNRVVYETDKVISLREPNQFMSYLKKYS